MPTYSLQGKAMPRKKKNLDSLPERHCAHDNHAGVSLESDSLPVDIAIYSGGMDETSANFLQWCRQPAGEASRCIIILATLGGTANIAYRISRALQKKYAHVQIAIPWLCKSAGTLLCIGAHSLLFGNYGELGPLDVQIQRKDEFFERSSGLTPLHALAVLRDESFSCFERYFLTIIENGRGVISTTRAAEIATNLTVSLLGKIYAQIDPMQLGQTTRDMGIAREYGIRLDSITKNLKEGALVRLLTAYPEHGFVIDGEEARELFKNVNPIPEDIEKIVAQNLLEIHQAQINGEPYFCVVSDSRIATVAKEDADEQKNGSTSSGENDGGYPPQQREGLESDHNL
jgi:hypothetical protein